MAKKKSAAKKEILTNAQAKASGRRRVVSKATNGSASNAHPAIEREMSRKIGTLLMSKSGAGILMGLQLLESLGAISADYELLFSDTVMKAILHRKSCNAWSAVARALRPHAQTLGRLEKLADESTWQFTDEESPCVTIRTLLCLGFPMATKSDWPGALSYQGWTLQEDTLTYRLNEKGQRSVDNETLLIDKVLGAWHASLPRFGEGVTIERVTLTSPGGQAQDAAEYFVHTLANDWIEQVNVGTRTTIIASQETD